METPFERLKETIPRNNHYLPLPMKSSKVRVLLFQTVTVISRRPSIRGMLVFSWKIGCFPPSKFIFLFLRINQFQSSTKVDVALILFDLALILFSFRLIETHRCRCGYGTWWWRTRGTRTDPASIATPCPSTCCIPQLPQKKFENRSQKRIASLDSTLPHSIIKP